MFVRKTEARTENISKDKVRLLQHIKSETFIIGTQKVRTRLGWPLDAKGIRKGPQDVPKGFRLLVQITSHNRLIPPGTHTLMKGERSARALCCWQCGVPNRDAHHWQGTQSSDTLVRLPLSSSVVVGQREFFVAQRESNRYPWRSGCLQRRYVSCLPLGKIESTIHSSTKVRIACAFLLHLSAHGTQ